MSAFSVRPVVVSAGAGPTCQTPPLRLRTVTLLPLMLNLAVAVLLAVLASVK